MKPRLIISSPRKTFIRTWGSSSSPTAGRLLTFAVVVLVKCFVASGQEVTSQASPPVSPLAIKAVGIESNEQYRIGPGDLLDIRVFKRLELSRDAVRVDARGGIRMPLIKEEINAACKTEAELEKEIETRYKKYLLQPQVSVFVKEFQSQPVAVLGSVKSPGRFILQRRLRILELLSFVGGPTELAGRTVQVVHAEQSISCESTSNEASDSTRATGVNFYQLSETLQGEAAANPYVQPGDTITIQAAEQVLIVGNVLKPLAIPLKDPITLTRAIALAGGVLPDTKREHVRIVRQSGGISTKDIYVDLKAIDKRQAEDILLQPNDIVEIPRVTGAGKALRDLMRTIVPTAASLPVRIIP